MINEIVDKVLEDKDQRYRKSEEGKKMCEEKKKVSVRYDVFYCIIFKNTMSKKFRFIRKITCANNRPLFLFFLLHLINLLFFFFFFRFNSYKLSGKQKKEGKFELKLYRKNWHRKICAYRLTF